MKEWYCGGLCGWEKVAVDEEIYLECFGRFDKLDSHISFGAIRKGTAGLFLGCVWDNSRWQKVAERSARGWLIFTAKYAHFIARETQSNTFSSFV